RIHCRPSTARSSRVRVSSLFLNDTATPEIYTLSYTTLFRSKAPADLRHRKSGRWSLAPGRCLRGGGPAYSRSERGNPWSRRRLRSEEHTSELQSRRDLVCRLLLEKTMS